MNANLRNFALWVIIVLLLLALIRANSSVSAAGFRAASSWSVRPAPARR